jgi:colanic acid/amylovoran biosynthesis protein
LNALFINCVCSNTGDAAILEGACEALRSVWEVTHVVVQDDHPDRACRLYPHMEVRGSCYWLLAYSAYPGWRDWVERQRRLMRFHLARRLWGTGLVGAARRLLSSAEADYLAAYDGADVVIATGGTYLVEQYDLGQRLFDMETAITLGRPLVLYTQSLGPFRNPKHRRRLRAIVRQASLVLLRDERSVQHVRDLNVPTERLQVAPDAAFALVDDDLATRSSARRTMAGRCPRVAISVRKWSYFPAGSAEQGMTQYRASFVSLVTHLVQRYNAEVTFLSTCQGVAGYHDDSLVAAAIVEALPDGIRARVKVDGDFHRPEELREILRGFDCVVSTRMHLAILALGVGMPVLPIAYEFKTTELCRMLGYAEPPLQIDELSPNKLIDHFDKFVSSYSAVAAQISQTVERFRNDAWEVAKALENSLTKRGTTTVHAAHPPNASATSNQQVPAADASGR